MKSVKKLLTVILMLLTVKTLHAQSKTGPDKNKLVDFYESQHYAEAAEYLKGFYTEGSNDTKAIAQLGYVYLMAGKLPEAENFYLKLYALQPKNLSLLFNLATLNIRRGNDQKAIDYYKEIIAIDSTNFNVYKQLSNLLKTSPQFSAGKTLFDRLVYLKKANALNNTDAEVAFDLSEAYLKINFYTQAYQVLEPALKADSSNLQLLKMKMPACQALKRFPEAINTGLKLLGYGDSTTFVLNNLAKSYYANTDYKNALTYYSKIKDKGFDNEGLMYSIALCYRELKDYKNSALFLKKAIKEAISPKTASYYGLLGDAYEELNQNEEANAAYKHGLQFENNGSLYYNIALVYETKLNDKKNAIVYYNLYLKNFADMDKNPKLAVFIKNKIEELKR
ncbi:tetratricopeptide repeat protein [Pedobacter nutrimenti]|uniref:Tetratricopeptide repeat protein n=1 Tax=Pedobacter nutrimenti TaxID=1241337 RepID=A0A318UCF5_9SPHI|nr:tetratricopeptide repeat protein [Pedobacter nutrimenti]PYF73931.1 tetratricopeptide repeat protein [Pedobacter nutrimenti]